MDEMDIEREVEPAIDENGDEMPDDGAHGRDDDAEGHGEDA